MIKQLTYYPVTKSPITAIRLAEKNNLAVVTIYHTSTKKLTSAQIMKKFNITDKDMIHFDDEKHEDFLHKPDKPFEFHSHIMIAENKLKNYLEAVFKNTRMEDYHLKRIFGKDQEKTFKDGSKITKKGFIDEKQIMKNLENKFNYLIKTDLVSEKELAQFFKKRGNWEPYNYGEDPNQYLALFDPEFWGEPDFFRFRSLSRNILKDRKLVTDQGNLLPYLMNKNRELDKYVQLYDRIYDLNDLYKKPSNLEDIDKKHKYFIKGVRYRLFSPVNSDDLNRFLITDDFQDFKDYVLTIIERNKHIWNKDFIKSSNNERKWYFRSVTPFYNENTLRYDEKNFLVKCHYIFKPSLEKGDNDQGFIHKDFRIYSSKIKFSKKDFTNPAMHYYNQLAKQDFEDYMLKNHSAKYHRYCISQIKNILKLITGTIDSKCFAENKSCFILLEASFFIKKDYKVFLWDIDERVSYFKEKKTYLDILEGIMKNIVDPLFPPKNKAPVYDNFIKISQTD